MVSFSPFPADPRPRRAAEALLNEGMTVDFVCIGDEKSPMREQSNGLSILRLPVKHRRGGKLSYVYQYAVFILAAAGVFAWRSIRRRYDLVWVHNMPDVLVASALAPKLLGAKVILDQHDPMPELMTTIYNLHQRNLAVRLLESLEKWSMARADAVVTVNTACQRIFSRRSCLAEKITVVMNAPDDQIFQFQPARLPVARNDTCRRPFVIMYHGSIVERNGLDLAIEALSRLRRTVPLAQLRIYGRRTVFLDSVMKDVHSKGLADRVEYRGPKSLEALVSQIDECDVGMIPNHRNDFADINTPTRIFKYLALGKPVIAPRTAGICDYFDDNSLVFFEAGDASDLAKKAEHVFKRPNEVFDIVRRGQEVYLHHCWPVEKQRLTELVTGLLC
jgi:glycosyltransferase involved in cell wall biosynthesis